MTNLRLTAEAKAIDFRFTITNFGLDSNALTEQTAYSDEQLQDLKSQIHNPKLIVLGESDRLKQILVNLLSNAIKFTSQGGKVEISLKTIGRLGAEEQVGKYQLPTINYHLRSNPDRRHWHRHPS